MTSTPPNLRSCSEGARVLDAFERRAGGGRIVVGGLFGSAPALLLAELAAARPLLVWVRGPLEVEALEDDLKSLARHLHVIAFRQMEDDSLDEAEGRVDLSERLALLKRLHVMKAGTVAVAPVKLLLESIPTQDDVQRQTREIEVGDTLAIGDLRRIAERAGYRFVPMIAAPAEISVRGDIIDLFPLGEKQPVRIELFDEQVESMRDFDLESQRSIRPRAKLSIPMLRPEELTQNPGRPTWLDDHLPDDAILVRVHPARLADRLEELAVQLGTDRLLRRRARAALTEAAGVDVVAEQVDDVADESFSLATYSVFGLGGGVDGLRESVAALRRRCRRIVVFAGSDGEVQRMRKLLREQELLDEDVTIRRGSIHAGFQFPALDTAWLNHLELLGRPRLQRPRPRRPAVPARAVKNLLELTPGDYVVHMTHGIARYGGMTRMTRDRGEEDFLVLEFDGGTTFYLPTSKIDLVQRYVGASSAPPKLDRIGGKSWSNKKRKVLDALEDLTDELLDVQVAREVRAGSVHPKDDPLIADFESSFPYADTLDQTRAMVDVHRDFDRSKPMDRLICGDVGFGKTEMAIRAAFRVICGGRQVAILVPTTLLADQHYQTIRERVAQYPIEVARLSRFRSRRQQQETIEALKRGAVDVVVGTHRLISKDVAFKDLGLVVVDEEQRFGVKAKEALKRLRKSVDVLTLTATPIPRTLHMALVGLRDISSLNTPPSGRRPVRTEIRAKNDEFLRRALLHELNRGGQVFFVHNRVQSIDRVADHLAGLVPSANVVAAHGQMTERALEDAMAAFTRGDADVLVATSIMESGLDLPRANTILIDRPDLFGLADLHQLRGRVGRSDVQGYCYLLTSGRPLSNVAERRLRAIEELSHLGAGYDVAIKDLEIRGAGNLLGASQSGHIAAVGYDLYVQLLHRAVARAQGQPPPKEPMETDVDLGVEAFVPAEYVPDAGQRMEILRRLGGPDGPSLTEMRAELGDRFGRIPAVAENLVTLYALKRRCREIGVRRLLYPGDDHVIVEVEDLRRFHVQPFGRDEIVQLTASIWHLRLPRSIRSSAQVLFYCRDRLLADVPNSAHAGAGA